MSRIERVGQAMGRLKEAWRNNNHVTRRDSLIGIVSLPPISTAIQIGLPLVSAIFIESCGSGSSTSPATSPAVTPTSESPGQRFSRILTEFGSMSQSTYTLAQSEDFLSYDPTKLEPNSAHIVFHVNDPADNLTGVELQTYIVTNQKYDSKTDAGIKEVAYFTTSDGKSLDTNNPATISEVKVSRVALQDIKSDLGSRGNPTILVLVTEGISVGMQVIANMQKKGFKMYDGTPTKTIQESQPDGTVKQVTTEVKPLAIYNVRP